jgi:hypothetical protein
VYDRRFENSDLDTFLANSVFQRTSGYFGSILQTGERCWGAV